MSGFPGLSDAVEGSTTVVLSLHRETKFIIGFDFAVALSSACVLRAPHRLTRPVFEAHPGANTFPPIAHNWPRDRALGDRSTFPALTLA